VAYCISCLGAEWSIHIEPTDEDTVGVIVYTSKGKALAAGTGEVLENGDLTFRVATLYEGITQAGNLSYEVNAKYDSQGNWQVGGAVKYTDPHLESLQATLGTFRPCEEKSRIRANPSDSGSRIGMGSATPNKP
jgi:hypothetical protein